MKTTDYVVIGVMALGAYYIYKKATGKSLTEDIARAITKTAGEATIGVAKGVITAPVSIGHDISNETKYIPVIDEVAAQIAFLFNPTGWNEISNELKQRRGW